MKGIWSCLLVIALLISVSVGRKLDYQKIEGTKFGKNLLDIITLQLGQKNGLVDELKQLLRDLNTQMLNDDDRSNKAHDQHIKKCEEDQAEFNSIIRLAEEILSNDKLKLADHETRLQKTLEVLNQTRSEYSFSAEKLQQATTRKNQDDQEFLIRVKENEEVEKVITRVLKMFNELKEGANSFLDVKSINFLQVSSFFMKQVKTLRNLKYRTMLEFLAQISERSKNMNDNLIEKIIELCSKILQNIEESSKSENLAHEARISAFSKFETEMKAIITKKESEVAVLSLAEKTIRGDIEKINRETEFQGERKERATEDLQRTMKNCEDELLTFEKQKSKRKEEIDIVSQLILIVKTDIEDLKQYIKDRVES